jgi:hypothetical protein
MPAGSIFFPELTIAFSEIELDVFGQRRHRAPGFRPRGVNFRQTLQICCAKFTSGGYRDLVAMKWTAKQAEIDRGLDCGGRAAGDGDWWCAHMAL